MFHIPADVADRLVEIQVKIGLFDLGDWSNTEVAILYVVYFPARLVWQSGAREYDGYLLKGANNSRPLHQERIFLLVREIQ